MQSLVVINFLFPCRSDNRANNSEEKAAVE